MKPLVILSLLLSNIIWAQNNPLDIFKPLVNHTWSAEGQWGDGSIFKQEVTLKFSLDNKIVLVESKGFIDTAQTVFGLRNHGIRQYDEKTGEILFWEFDVFGGLTKGQVRGEGKNLVYTYDYGGSSLTEMWVYKDEDSYTYIVGIFDDHSWAQKFLETEFVKK